MEPTTFHTHPLHTHTHTTHIAHQGTRLHDGETQRLSRPGGLEPRGPHRFPTMAAVTRVASGDLGGGARKSEIARDEEELSQRVLHIAVPHCFRLPSTMTES